MGCVLNVRLFHTLRSRACFRDGPITRARCGSSGGGRAGRAWDRGAYSSVCMTGLYEFSLLKDRITLCVFRPRANKVGSCVPTDVRCAKQGLLACAN